MLRCLTGVEFWYRVGRERARNSCESDGKLWGGGEEQLRRCVRVHKDLWCALESLLHERTVVIYRGGVLISLPGAQKKDTLLALYGHLWCHTRKNAFDAAPRLELVSSSFGKLRRRGCGEDLEGVGESTRTCRALPRACEKSYSLLVCSWHHILMDLLPPRMELPRGLCTETFSSTSNMRRVLEGFRCADGSSHK